jgi:hypothetical protein
LRVVLARMMNITGSEPLSCFSIWGGSASSGRRRMTRVTRSRTSLAAESMSRLAVNCTLTEERSSRLCEVTLSTPSRPATSFSTICVMRVSTTAALAPR